MSKRHFIFALFGALALFGSTVATCPGRSAEGPTPAQVAAQADKLLAEEVLASASGSSPAAARCDDATFLRRAHLDLIGRQPTAEESTQFVLDPAADKREKLVEQLLSEEAFGTNWARYWRDVILSRRSEPRALLAAGALEKFLAEELNKGTSWIDITRSFITATGDVQEVGAAALIMAQEGKAEETTAEVARIFLGIQIQCAQCHDHPTDRWKRQQFHELAAFFPRITVRPVQKEGNRRSFEVVSVNREPRFRGPMGNRGSLEHYMPDLENPTDRGTLTQPKFFLTGRSAEKGLSDEDRRQLIANWLTSGTNPWFAKAFVNRVWSELVGEGFYEPVDDMGPDRQCSAPKTLDYLAEQFERNHCDVKWLYATVMSTEAYQRASRDRRAPDGTPFAANCPQPLRADQLLDNLVVALGIETRGFGGAGRGFGPYGGGMRAVFAQIFGYDPSLPRDEVAASIPQALYLMNSPQINAAIDARRRDTELGRLLSTVSDDKQVVFELYLKTLAREPKPAEIDTCLEHVKSVGDRREAFEDVLWSLVNCSEFLHRK